MNESTYEDWTVVLKTSTDFEADLVRDRLDDAGVPAVVLTQRDHAFNLNVGDLAAVHVLVPPDRADEALQVINASFTDSELEQAALSAKPAPDAHDSTREAMLDSGIEEIRFTFPDEDEDVEDLE